MIIIMAHTLRNTHVSWLNLDPQGDQTAEDVGDRQGKENIKRQDEKTETSRRTLGG
jgi:hypothetical protein